MPALLKRLKRKKQVSVTSVRVSISRATKAARQRLELPVELRHYILVPSFLIFEKTVSKMLYSR
ncbi:MAG: hypothetical protein ACI9XU_001294 [Arenicella sp.]|jgi:hypothetical protein